MHRTPRRDSTINVIGRLAGAFGLTTLLAFGATGAAHADNPISTSGAAVTPGAALLDRAPTLEQTYAEQHSQRLQLASALGAGYAGKQPDPTGILPKPFPFALRLGAMISPRTKFAGGIDVSFPQLSIAHGFISRVDADVIVSFNFGGVSTLIPITFDQVYSKGLIAGSRIYGGAGIGPYIGDKTRFGGKLFVGGDFTSSLGAELGLHFSGYGDPLLTLQARVHL